MESTGLRQRGTLRTDQDIHSVDLASSEEWEDPFQPPRYTIDLSLQPRDRYRKVAQDFKSELQGLHVLFDEVVQYLHPRISIGTVRLLARLLMRRLSSREETEQLRGINDITGVDMYLLIALNVLLDLLMGCTSGGVRVEAEDRWSKMLHFRTLDWGMDALRQVIVHLDFVETTRGPIIASSITYAGYVGLLTGVRKGLSVSLNFRPNHDASSRLANCRFYIHHLLVLFGFRPSISSLLRRCLMSSHASSIGAQNIGESLETIEQRLPSIVTTAAYLIFSDGRRTIAMEKDHRTALVTSTEEFIVVTNHDVSEETSDPSHMPNQADAYTPLEMTGMMTRVEESMDRKSCAVDLWQRATKRRKRGSGNKSIQQQKSVCKASSSI